MDYQSTTTAGIDPKILDCWQDSTLGVYDPPDYTTTDSADTTAANNSPAELFPSGVKEDLSSSSSSPKFSVRDAASPRTLSTDDNFQLPESWQPQLQLLSPMANAMASMESAIYHHHHHPSANAKAAPDTTNTVIVDDVGDFSSSTSGPRFTADLQSDQFMPPPYALSAYPFADSAWGTTTAPAIPPEQQPSLGMEPPLSKDSTTSPLDASPLDSANPLHDLRSLESRWLDALDSQVHAAAPYGTVPFDYSPKDQEFQYSSENSSVSDDVPGTFEFPAVSAGGAGGAVGGSAGPTPALASAQLDDDTFVVGETAASRPRALSVQRPGTAGRTPLSLQSTATVRKKKQRSSTVSVDQGQSKPLQIVQEDGQGGSIASADFISPPRGARRKGPLSMAGRANAGMRRKNKDTCVQCRLNKRKCDGHSPCDACRPTLHEQPCARACFSSIVEYGTCNYISQRAVNHPTTDRSSTVRMEIPSELDLSALLSYLGERQGQFNIRASQSWGSLYVLDLSETYRFLKGLSEYNGNNRSNFLEFIDRRIIESKDKSKNWLTCVKDCDPINNIYSLLSQWTNMPSRAAYSFVPLTKPNGNEDEEEPMDIHNPSHKQEILLAAQLSRIICRMLEVEGFRRLERDFYNIKWKQISQETHLRFLSELGHILLSLRWRVSWWKRLGDGGRTPDPSKQHYVDRVELLCRILYVYYTCVLAKLPSWSTADVPKGVWSRYADTKNPVWDDFPLDSSDDGFQKWMARGSELIELGKAAGASK